LFFIHERFVLFFIMKVRKGVYQDHHSWVSGNVHYICCTKCSTVDEWKQYECPRMGNRFQYCRHLMRRCYVCTQMEEEEMIGKTPCCKKNICMDCSGRILMERNPLVCLFCCEDDADTPLECECSRRNGCECLELVEQDRTDAWAELNEKKKAKKKKKKNGIKPAKAISTRSRNPCKR